MGPRPVPSFRTSIICVWTAPVQTQTMDSHILLHFNSQRFHPMKVGTG